MQVEKRTLFSNKTYSEKLQNNESKKIKTLNHKKKA